MSLSLKTRFHNIIEAAAGKEQTLSSIEIINQAYNGPEDEIISAKGVAGYFEMLRDAKISAGMETAISLSIPGITIEPGDDSDKGIRNADFMRDILSAIPGSTIDNIRDPYGNALKSGMSVIEPQIEIISLPEWGSVMGVTALNLKPTCSFTDGGSGIKVDRFGNILEFKQDAMHGGNSATPDQVIYYAFRGNANNRYGQSLLYSVYDPWKRKQKIFRIYALFMATNASGIREIKLPSMIGKRATTEADLTSAQARMRRLATSQTLATMKDWETNIHTPGSGTGGHFLEMIQEEDRQISSGILGDSAFSSQDQGSYSSREVSQSNVQSRMRAWGDSYMDAFSEQFCPMILEANGFDGAVPRIVADLVEDAGSRIEKYKVAGELKQAGIFTMAFPEQAQKQIAQDLGIDTTQTDENAQGEASAALNGAQITAGQGIVVGVTDGTVAPGSAVPLLVALGIPQKTAQAMVDAAQAAIKPVTPVKPTITASEIIHAAAPSGRDNATLKRNGKQYDTIAKDGAADLSATWAGLVPQIMKKLESQIFNPKLNGWKVTNLNKLRQIAIDTTKYKSSEMRKSMDATLRSGNDLGDKHATAMVPVIAQERLEAAAGFTPAAVIQSLQNHTFLTLEQKYPKVASDIYYLLENAVRGDVAPNVVRAQMHTYLMEGSAFTPGLANTIIETSLSSAYNDARMSIFRQIVDTTGNTPGAIIGYVASSIMDAFTTDICTFLDGRSFVADDPSLPQYPLHFNCRGQLVPVFAGEVPWTKESGGTFTTTVDSKAFMANAQAKGWIQPGFGAA